MHCILQGLAYFDLREYIEELEEVYQKRLDMILEQTEDFIPLQFKMIKFDADSQPMVNNPILNAYKNFVKERLPKTDWKLSSKTKHLTKSLD